MTILTDDLLASFDASVADFAKALTMPPQIYTSDEFLEFERRAVFANEWLCVGRASRIPNVGDYFTTTANTEPIIVARAKDGNVHAFSAISRSARSASTAACRWPTTRATAASSPVRTTCGATT
jgi:hypothetical protein